MQVPKSKFPIVRRLALERGVKPFTVNKWLQRQSIPSEHLVPIIIESGGLLSLMDFADACPNHNVKGNVSDLSPHAAD